MRKWATLSILAFGLLAHGSAQQSSTADNVVLPAQEQSQEALALAGTAWGQTYKGNCEGTQSDSHDLAAIPNTPAIKCDYLSVVEKDGHTSAIFFRNGSDNPALAFTGNLAQVNSGTLQPSDPYIGPITSFFPIATVLWGDGSPLMQVHAPAQFTRADAASGRGCYFHHLGQQLTEVECTLSLFDKNYSRYRRATVTFKTERDFTVDGQQISVEYGVDGFHTKLGKLEIQGTCGLGTYQTYVPLRAPLTRVMLDGILRHVVPGTPIERVFQVVCYGTGVRTN
jgi:hypothetical protein